MIALVAVVAGGALWALTRQREPAASASVTPAAVAPSPTTSAPAAPALPPPPPLASPDLSPGADDGSGAGGPTAGYAVDLDALRAKLPNNRYWELGAPSDDPAVARARAERAERSNKAFGRAQTGEASEEEIRAYYAEQKRISSDYLELSLTALAEYGAQLPERDRGMFELSAQLHRAKLVQIDRDLADALERRRARAR